MNQITAENLELLDARHRVAVFAIAAQVVAVAALLLLSFKEDAIVFSNVPDGQTIMSLRLSILFFAGISILLRRLFNGWERLKGISVLHGIGGLTKRLFINAVVTSSFGVACAVVGFIVSQMTGDPMEAVRAAVVAFVVFFANFPRKSGWKTVVSKLQES